MTVRERPAEELTANCPVPVIELGTNGGLAHGIVRLAKALELCNEDKAALRAWADN